MTDKNVVLEGYMKKLKTTKKKYFVLFGDTRDMFAHLRYYDSEKKFKQSLNKRDTPNSKKCIILRECFNINRRLDTRHPNVLALYTKEECFSMIFEFEEDLHKWLNALLRLQKGSSLNDSEPTPRPQFDHIWEVNIEKKGLGESKGLHGPYRLCICEKNLSFIKAGVHLTPNRDINLDIIDISLGSIRRYGAQQCYFYLEIGRVSKTGPGELYLATADPLTAQNLYDTILRYVKQGKVIEESTAVYHRDRSLSVNETSKPAMQYNIGSMDLNPEIKPYNDSCHRERCDSLPSSNVISLNKTKSGTRPYSVCSRSPTTPSPLSPMSHTLSSKSDEDSSFIVDEVDSIEDVSKNFKNLSCSHSKMTILEETSEDMSISEKGHSHLHENASMTTTDTLTEKQEYLEMLPSLESKTRTEVRSRTSSFAEEISSNFGYNARFHLPDGLSSSASSVTSGTPSTDTRFSAFHLEKTFSHFSEDGNDFVLRPTRTYSVGSKPDNIKSKALDGFNIDAHKNSTRIRAFSVGSKVKNRLNDLGKVDTKEKKLRKPQSDKCTSVPALIKTPKSGISDQAEISFQNKSGSLNRSIFGSPKNTDSSEYMVMQPNNNNSDKIVQETVKSDYVEMGARSDRFSSKPIEIVMKKNNDKFQSHDTTSSPQIDYTSEIDSHNTMFPLSLDKNSIWDMKSLRLESELTSSNSQEHQHALFDNTQHIDEGDYATLMPGDGIENKKDEDMKDFKPNYIDLYFPQQNKENNCNPKKDDTTTKSTYAQIVFPDFQPK